MCEKYAIRHSVVVIVPRERANAVQLARLITLDPQTTFQSGEYERERAK